MEKREGGKVGLKRGMGQARKPGRTIFRRMSAGKFPTWASSSTVLFKYSIDKAHSQYKEKSAVLLKVRPGDTGR